MENTVVFYIDYFVVYTMQMHFMTKKSYLAKKHFPWQMEPSRCASLPPHRLDELEDHLRAARVEAVVVEAVGNQRAEAGKARRLHRDRVGHEHVPFVHLGGRGNPSRSGCVVSREGLGVVEATQRGVGGQGVGRVGDGRERRILAHLPRIHVLAGEAEAATLSL